MHLGLCDTTYKEAHYLGAAFVAGALVLIIGASIAAAGQRFSSWAPVVVEVGYVGLTAFALTRLASRR